MEYGSIEREIRIDAPPEVVYEVISTPEHLREWWPDDAELAPFPGATGTSPSATRPRRTRRSSSSPSWRPNRPAGSRSAGCTGGGAGGPGNSLLVTFELVPVRRGTLVRFNETGFREPGGRRPCWRSLPRPRPRLGPLPPRLVTYANRLVARP